VSEGKKQMSHSGGDGVSRSKKLEGKHIAEGQGGSKTEKVRVLHRGMPVDEPKGGIRVHEPELGKS